MQRICTLTAMISLAIVAASAASATADSAARVVEEPRTVTLTPLLGTLQPLLLSGWNVELDLRVGNFVVGYSHGWSLEIPATGATDEQQLRLLVPYSTGIGLGYEHRSGLSLRLEPKLHRFEVDYADASLREEKIADYRTVTVGAGLYYAWRPLARRRGWTRGLTVAASIRYWPNVWSSLDDGEVRYQNRATEQEEVHRGARIGVANTPWVGNLSLGYAFDFVRQKE